MILFTTKIGSHFEYENNIINIIIQTTINTELILVEAANKCTLFFNVNATNERSPSNLPCDTRFHPCKSLYEYM